VSEFSVVSVLSINGIITLVRQLFNSSVLKSHLSRVKDTCSGCFFFYFIVFFVSIYVLYFYSFVYSDAIASFVSHNVHFILYM